MKTASLSLVTALAFAGCASAPQPNAALESARSAVRSAEADPNVPKYAALDLQAAQKDLQQAEDASMHHQEAAIGQPAYLAAQEAKLAQLHASAKADDARVAAGQAERDQIQLQARSREAANANREAADANMARSQEAAKAAQLQAEVDALKAKPTDRGLVLTLGDVLFDTGKATLNSGAGRKLDQLAQFLTDHPDRRVEIDGFTDSVGSDAYNQELSQRRADAVKAALVGRGIDPTRVNTEGYGKDFAVASNADASGRQQNRRVEVVIGGENGAPVTARSH
jgi:outer membrane protein OmpA-like peptidoglycan-associated protein